MPNVYDVTTWTIPDRPGVTAYDDIGAVINDIIRDVKARQPDQASKPGAVVYIPPGDYSLKTRVLVDISYLQIKGSGHGFTSSSIRYNSGDTSSWHEIWPGASRVRVENTDGHPEGFLVQRDGSPRLSSIEFRDFCLDGVSFTGDQNSYRNGKVAIRCGSDNDSFRVEGMGFVYLERGLVVTGADALNVTNNFIAECGSCVELVGSGQACKVTDNQIGAGHVGFSIFAEHHFGLLISGNNVFPRGRSLVHLKQCNNSVVTANRFHGFYPGMIDTEGECNENLFSSNHFLRQVESFPPMQQYGNGKDDLYGLIHLRGSGNMVSTNLFTYSVPAESISPAGARPTIVLVGSGDENFISSNHTRASVDVHAVVLDGSTTRTKVLDSATTAQFQAFTSDYSFRPTP